MSVSGDSVKVVHYGLGQIGTMLAKLTGERPKLVSVAAVDPNPELVGSGLSALAGNAVGDVTIRGDLGSALEGVSAADVAFHAVASDIPTIESQFIELAEAGLNVVTTAEQLIHPYSRHADAAARIHDAAVKNGVTIFAAGINPGFLMDRLPAYLTSVCTRVDDVYVTRLVDLGTRRPALRRKMAVGETAEAVSERVESKTIGHVGLMESLEYVMAMLGWELQTADHSLGPVVAETHVEKIGEVVEPGSVLGMAEKVVGTAKDGRKVTLDLTMRLDADHPFDEVRISGEPDILLRFEGGVAGDQATAATVLNAAEFACRGNPGLVAHLPTPAAN